MNDRIKELRQEAWRYANNYVGDDIGVKSQLQRFEEKFAELIIKECAELAGCNAHVSGFALGDLIKEHFGIRE